jgi:hypothetical protein
MMMSMLSIALRDGRHAILLMMITVAGSVLPARVAGRINPLGALRAE